MPWDGNGTFDRVHNFSADASAGIQAQAVRFDAEFDGLKTGLENCQTLDGQTTVTGNAPMGGYKHTGVAVAASTDNYLRADQFSNQVGIYVRDVNTGLSGAMSASPALFPTSFTDGQRITVKVSASGSAAATRRITINGLSANIIDKDGNTVNASRMQKDGIFDLIYDADASAFRAITPDSHQTGKFSFSWKGFVGVQSTSAEYHKQGNMVMLTFHNTFQISSSATNFNTTTSVIPAIIRPGVTAYIPARVTDAGTEDWGYLAISSTGAFTFYSDAASSLFSANGIKGTRAYQMWSYFVDDA